MDSYYLKTISKLQELFKPHQMHPCIGGGYAIDGYLHKITRIHDDLDIDIVGKVPWVTGQELLLKILQENFGEPQEKNGHYKIDDGNHILDIEYVEDKSTNTQHIYQFGNEQYTFPFPLYKFGDGVLEGVTFDIENPHMIFAIKYLMPISGEKNIREKGRKDIELLVSKLDKRELINALKFQLDYILSIIP